MKYLQMQISLHKNASSEQLCLFTSYCAQFDRHFVLMYLVLTCDGHVWFPGQWASSGGRPILRVPGESQPNWCGQHLPGVSLPWRQAGLPCAHHQSARRGESVCVCVSIVTSQRHSTHLFPHHANMDLTVSTKRTMVMHLHWAHHHSHWPMNAQMCIACSL